MADADRSPAPGTVRPLLHSSEALSVFTAVGMDLPEAVRLLAAGREELTYSLEEFLLQAERRTAFLSALFEGFPERVRAVHGVQRAALIQAARVVLAGMALARCRADQFSQGGTRDLVNGAARAYGWPPDCAQSVGIEQPADAALLEGIHQAGLPTRDALAVVGTYLDLAGPLADACPEFGLSVGLPLGRSGARTPGSLRSGLAGLGLLLASFACRDELVPSARALLDGPITTLDVRGPTLPSLENGYVNPRYRLAIPDEDGFQQVAASDKWWDGQPLHEDIECFFASYLLSLPALLSPLLVLGHPGAGKSLLTKLLSARLPADEFRSLRVELRYTPADVDVHAQLEHALRRATGRAESWPDWVEREPGVIPVVLLDGFDELLQAGAQRIDSGRQWNYLREIEAFQRREAEHGRPLVVVVTSRTVVAGHAEIPRASQVLRVEPFEEPEIEQWLSVWNTTNRVYLARQGLRSLSFAVLAPHRRLAAQPLLLLMLALYHADDNDLHRLSEEGISRTELYERLLTTFVRRQLIKDGPLPASEEHSAIERELHRLSVIALGMFQRGAQSITSGQAEEDLRALADGVTGGDLLFGRFFFVHEAQAVVAEQRMRSYEFMHATFGEHLTARLVDRALRKLSGWAGDRQQLPDDSELYALLSFTPLTDRAQIVQDLADMMSGWESAGEWEALPELLARLFGEVRWEASHRSGHAHAPTRQTRAYRDAVYGANLLLIGILAGSETEVYASDFLGSDDLVDQWRRLTLLWQSQLSKESWDVYTSVLRPERVWRMPAQGCGGDARPDLRLGTERVPFVQHELGWSLGYPDTSEPQALDEGNDDDVPNVARRVMFVGDRDAELLLDVVHPLLHRLPSALRIHGVDRYGCLRSAGQALAALLTHDVYDSGVLPDLYVRCLSAVLALPGNEGEIVLEAVCERLTHDADGMSDLELRFVIRHLNECLKRADVGSLRAALAACVERILGRGDLELGSEVAKLQTYAVQDPLSDPVMLVRLIRAGRSAGFLGSLHRMGRDRLIGVFDDCVSDPVLPVIAACHPFAVIELLRLAAEFGLTDWLAAHTADLLVLLPDNAFGLLRPSDLGFLRDALPEGGYGYEAEFTEVEESFRPKARPRPYTARSPASAVWASGSPSPPGRGGP
ncbi:hypothetical protein [Streptomyces sp. NPDC050263]|uniref:NACHT domain-containing protein n=1 Tax=Streptomyces sp. NPDC050263 TaxID=3155037 RepID=UPI0034163DDC